ncbi:ras-like protein family member 11A [Bufo gargarizans]|uniref:ras-like protein family member 11A n=1 Tax=Bufo gargarizans TaxID=30331 RepID=UPI001CF4677E|nr:ras-like protein family member 11A [Bufo gargarizans]
MRLPTMSSNFLLAPIPESADYFTVRDIKMVVMGASSVGKTAMIVRFLTKRFIGDYESNTGNLYSRLVSVEGEHMSVQIQDTPGYVKVDDDVSQVADMLRCVQSSEGFLLVYSITDYRSFEYIRHLHQHIRKVHSDTKTPIILVANKGDLLHMRQVPSEAGIQLASELGCSFVEISTSENCQDVCDVFQHLCKEISKHQSSSNGEKRRGSIIPRPKSPNMQDLKRRFKQALSPKVKTPSAMA